MLRALSWLVIGKSRATLLEFAAEGAELEMKHLFQILAVMLLACAPMQAQTGPTGTWIAEGVGQEFPWEVVLRPDGPNRLLGAVSSCASVRRPIESVNPRFGLTGETLRIRITRL
jgi:hypothetical protein